MPVTIRRARTADAAALAELAARIFHDTFARSNSAEDMEAFLAGAYTESRQRAETEDPAIITLLAEAGALIGYAQVRSGEPPPCVTGRGPVEIMRFYVEKAHHGSGVAQMLMGEVERVAAGLGAGTLWLGVWERNDRALAFYRKQGFREVGTAPFVVGKDVQTDLVLERPLTRRA
ncbi:MAG TPA: GNAT family N-acetyltransferase [Thermoanaerobaculia bacterium]|nr:GNAT family N-acetyltransferase [Thermoanaerobaculia bacterium]